MTTIVHGVPPTEQVRRAAIELMHVGENGPLTVADGTIVRVVARRGDVVETILKEAKEQQVDLIAMPTAGHHGLLDALRGSTAGCAYRVIATAGSY